MLGLTGLGCKPDVGGDVASCNGLCCGALSHAYHLYGEAFCVLGIGVGGSIGSIGDSVGISSIDGNIDSGVLLVAWASSVA